MEQTIQSERQDSIKVNMTSKGAFSFEIKRYYNFEQDEPKLVIQSMKKQLDELKEQFKTRLDYTI